jgi:hypothetical protein
MARLRVVVASLLLLAIPTLARAQAGWYLTPSLSLSEEYQSNIFGTSSNEESDFVTRITPGLTIGYLSEPLTFSINYSIDAEVFAENSDLNNFGDNQRTGLLFLYRPDRRWTLGLTGSFAQSEDSGHLLVPTTGLATPAGPTPTPTPGVPPSPGAPPSPGTPSTAPAGTAPVVPGVDVGRNRTRYVVVAPTVSYAYDLRTTLDGGYTYTWTDVENGAQDQSHSLTVGGSRGLTPRDRVHLRDLLNIFVQEDSGTSVSNAVLVGWSRQLTERTSLFLEAGPRINDDGDWGVDATARLEHQFRNGGVFLSYMRTDQLVVGRAGPSTTDTGSLGVTYTPARDILLSAAAVVSHITSSDDSNAVGDDTTYGITLSAVYRLREWLSVRGYYLGTFQEGGSGDIQNHTVGIALDMSYPFRLY